jgi:perosamine synthetase
MSKAHLAINGGEKAIITALSGRSHFGEEERAAVNALFDAAIAAGSAPGYNGPEEDAYCQEFAEYLGGGYADGVNSGTNSVYVALKALNPQLFSEVVVGCVTDNGGMMPIVMANCIPVPADAAPGKYNSGPEQIEARITERTSAIIIAHIGGEPADIEGIIAVADKYDIPVVEDCAQAHGAEINGRKVGTFGKTAAFSTMFGKHHCSGGQGGMVFTRDEDLYWKIRRVADRGKPFGLAAGSTNSEVSLNFNMDEMGATIGRVQLKKLPMIIEKRLEFLDLLMELGFGELKAVEIPSQPADYKPSYWWVRTRFVADAVSCDKVEFCEALSAEGLLVGADYSAALPTLTTWFKERANSFPWNAPQYQGDAAKEYPIPNAIATIAGHFNLYIYESWGRAEAEMMVKAFRKVEDAYAK